MEPIKTTELIKTTTPVIPSTVQRYIFRFCEYRALAAVAVTSRKMRKFVEDWREGNTYMMLLVERDTRSLVARHSPDYQAVAYRLYMAVFCTSISGDMTTIRYAHEKRYTKITDLLTGTGVSEKPIGEQLAYAAKFLAIECESVDLLRLCMKKLGGVDLFGVEPPEIKETKYRTLVNNYNYACSIGRRNSGIALSELRLALPISGEEVLSIARNLYPGTIGGMIGRAKMLCGISRELGMTYDANYLPVSYYSPIIIGRLIDNYTQLGSVGGGMHYGPISYNALCRKYGLAPTYDDEFFRTFISGVEK